MTDPKTPADVVEAIGSVKATLSSIRAMSVGEDWAESARHIHDLCGDELRSLAALQATTTQPDPCYAYPVGAKVEKPKGYPFPGTVVAAFANLSGEPRYVVESELAPGMLHIFSEVQLVRASDATTQPDAVRDAVAQKAEFPCGTYGDGSGPKVTVRYDTTPPRDPRADCRNMIWMETGPCGANWIAFDYDVAEDVIAAIRQSAAAIRASEGKAP